MEDTGKYTVSIQYDQRLYKHDIKASTTHAQMLARQGIISQKESADIISGLSEIQKEIEKGEFPWKSHLEDLHMNIENRLYEKSGDVAGKLHTARSRNDQVATDMRLYVKDAITVVISAINDLRRALLDSAKTNSKVIMPGYTHLQRAQPVFFSHHMMAYFDMFGRDRHRFEIASQSADVLPLGSGAIAGVTYPIDREYVAKELGFKKISSNSMDAVSDRDFLLDFHSAAATCFVHISRMGEELVMWSSEEFDFIRLADEYTTGSSMMPQKRNPDFAELARGKSGRVFGNLIGLLTVLKGLPLTYNRDLQEDKEGFFDTYDTLLNTLQVLTKMYSSMQLNKNQLTSAAESSHVLATDIADYLVNRGLPFRDAYKIVAKISEHALQNNLTLSELTLDDFLKFSSLFSEDVSSINLLSSIENRNIFGGTASQQISESISRAEKELKAKG